MQLPFQKTTRRSDEIRRRREKKSRAGQNSSPLHKRKLVTPAPPPVMVRKPLASTASTQPRPAARRQQKIHRLHNFRLNPAQGAEISLPALPRISLNWRFVSSALAFLLGFTLYQLWNSPGYRVDAAQVSDLQYVTSSDINMALGIVGQPIFTIDPPQIQADLLAAFPELTAAEVQVEFPNTVAITVTGRLPVMVWQQDGKSYLVDKDGWTFPVRHETATGNLPVVEATGKPPGVTLPDRPETSIQDLIDSKVTGKPLPTALAPTQANLLLSTSMVKSILLVADQAPAGARLIYDPAHGLGWKDRRGWDVYLGNEQEIEIKLSIYRSILDSLKGSENRPVMISVEYVHAPYYRLEQ